MEHGITNKEFIPITMWGKDHWSTLAYIDSVIAEHSFYPITIDSHMRTKRETYDYFLMNKAKKFGFITQPYYNFLSSDAYGTKLNDGTTVMAHDDYSCIVDFAKEGLLNIDENSIITNKKIKFSDKGLTVMNCLHKHKVNGGTYSNFTMILKKRRQK